MLLHHTLKSILLAGSLALTAAGSSLAGQSAKQYVLISFDGAGANTQWERSLALADGTGARFTYFISCANILPQKLSHKYESPEGRSGKSNIGFAVSSQDVRTRLLSIWHAASSGHEIANHTCGHFDGKTWSREQWASEFKSFDDLLANAFANINAGYEPNGWREFVRQGIRGFRAPYLSTSPALYQSLAKRGFTYDASGIERETSGARMMAGLARFSLPMIQEGPSKRRIIAMDYNLFIRHSGGFERAGDSAEFEQRSYEAFRGAFEAQYNGKRNPVQIGMHFTLMNAGAYWRAMERLVREVCVKPDVKCTSYSRYLDENPPAPAQLAKARLRGDG